ncbi:hypothetical protein HPB49_007580 [Dermacentor silvarum]|uniref:Uncharacterized protein n=1 Tax=Dermacentor silvarum TaxID=543639 RepID=A0ACB8C2I6_DERSI|nr:hypothetical protein HPB49_007580 [Dermacentor silvarum]
MAGNPNANDACLPATGPMELVPTQRGGFKAEYLGRTFTMESRKRSRYYWRCDIRCCKARLSTDVYGSDHMVYTFKAHNERLHQRATCETKRKRCSATNMKKTKFRQNALIHMGSADYQRFSRKLVKCTCLEYPIGFHSTKAAFQDQVQVPREDDSPVSIAGAVGTEDQKGTGALVRVDGGGGPLSTPIEIQIVTKRHSEEQYPFERPLRLQGFAAVEFATA